jgi:pimeloyl-ACP methyl ester carboxylesterase
MRIPSDFQSSPTVDEIDFKALYIKSEYDAETADGWLLKITRYQPRAQPFEQPVYGEPLLLVHGFSQNRHAWTAGQFVKNLLYFGVDIHILELRGHGKSSVELQRQRHAGTGKPLPRDLDYGWDLDDYLLYDLPAAIEAVKRVTGRAKIFFCGHSMGGILGYGYAGRHDDLEGLITIGSPSELGSDFLPLRLLAHMEPALVGPVDLAVGLMNVQQSARHRLAQSVSLLGKVPGLSRLTRGREEPKAPEPLAFNFIPMDAMLRFFERGLSSEKGYRTYERLSGFLVLLSNPERVTADDIRWLLRHGGEREPRKVLAQFARWIRNSEMKCYRTGYDFRQGFARIKIPMAIIFGDMDKLASLKSTRAVYRAAQSEYLLWRPVKGNSHLELTMGHDIRQICYDVKNLIAYAREHRSRAPSLPRREG